MPSHLPLPWAGPRSQILMQVDELRDTSPWTWSQDCGLDHWTPQGSSPSLSVILPNPLTMEQAPLLEPMCQYLLALARELPGDQGQGN